jgi:hypothetical protein
VVPPVVPPPVTGALPAVVAHTSFE